MPRQTQYIVVSGSREWTDFDFIRARLQMLESPGRVRVGYDPVRSYPKGADEMVWRACRKIGIDCDCFPADWEAHGKKAGVLRNEEMFIQEPKPVHFIAFWVGNSPGTRDAVRRAYQNDVPWIEIHRRPSVVSPPY